MFLRKKEPSTLDRAYDRALGELMVHAFDSDDYAKALDLVERLHSMKKDQPSSSVSPDTKASVAANLLGIFMIIRHEHVNVIASKALGFVTKTRI